MNPFTIKTPKAENEQHLNNIRNKPCIICGDWTTTEAAHFRMADAQLGKKITGIGIKPRGPNGEECWTFPLCGRHHRRQHEVGEAKFGEAYHWINFGAVCLALWVFRNDSETMEEICKNNQKPEKP